MRFFVFAAILLTGTFTHATTYYVAQKSTSGNGLSWSSPWTSLTQVNNGVQPGDTVFFGTGVWRGLIRARGGSYLDRTCYASSSFADTNAAGEYHFAKIYGSQDMSGGWTSIGGNRYQKAWTASVSMPQLYQEDTILWRQTSLVAVNTPGTWYYAAGTLTVYVNDLGSGFHPDGYELEMSEGQCVSLDQNGSTDGQDHVTFWGLEFKYTHVYSVVTTINSMEVDPYDSVFIDHCKLSMNAGWYGSNPALIYSGYSGGTPLGRFNRVRACSLGNSWGLSDIDYTPSSNKGSGICHYSQSDYLIDSCVFYGYFKEGAVYWKAAYGGPRNENNVIRYNLFTNEHGSGVEFFGAVYKAEIYGNLFLGTDKGFFDRYDDWSGMGYHRIYNNTFVDCPQVLNWSTGDGIVPTTHNEFKYNVIYNSGGLYSRIDSYSAIGSAQFTDINNNLYYAGGSYQLVRGSTSYGPSQWQALGMDVSSSFGVDPDFADISIDDYRRVNAVQEMDTTYGGTRWQLYGALQAGAAPPPPDITPPIITGVATTGLNASKASIVWRTDEPATSRVEYGLTTSYGQQTPLNASLVTSHVVNLTGLDSSKTYHYRVTSVDKAGNSRTSGDFTFTTLAKTVDNIAAGIPATVCGSYGGYSSATLTDGVKNPRTLSATWASDESSTAAHWVEINFGEDKAVNHITMNWAWNPAQNRWMTSQRYTIQAWDGTTWTDLYTQINSTFDSATTSNFAEIITSRIRVYQPANMGPATYSVIMWLSELEVFGGEAVHPANTFAGTNISVNVDPAFRVIFAQVLDSGYTEIKHVSSAPSLPDGMGVVPSRPPTYFQLVTTAVIAGDITILASYPDADVVAGEDNLTLRAWDGTSWNNITNLIVASGNTILATTSTPTVFAITQPCCPGLRGNIDLSWPYESDVTIGDLVLLVNFMFDGNLPIACPSQADWNGDHDINIADLTMMVSYMFKNGSQPASCQ